MTMAAIGASSYRRFQQEQEAVLDRILTEYSDALVRYAYSIVHHAAAAEDIAAESIAILLSRRRNLRNEENLRAYLYRIVNHKSIDYLRQNRNEVPMEDVENVLGGGDPAVNLLLQERNRQLYCCMQQLPQQYRQILQLAYLEEFDVKSICRILGKSTKQVYNLLSRARSSLKSLLEKEGITYEDI